MPEYSTKSLDALGTCHPDLRRLFIEVIKHIDCSVLEGHRSLERQAQLLREGKTKVARGKHNAFPSDAVDVVPYPIDWNDRERFALFAGFVLGVANQMGIHIRWGGDWNRNGKLKDESFQDFPHFELIP